MKKILILMALFSVLTTGSLFAEEPGTEMLAAQEPAASAVDAGDTSWVLIFAALVMLMTPGLALFYGGMVRRNAV